MQPKKNAGLVTKVPKCWCTLSVFPLARDWGELREPMADLRFGQRAETHSPDFLTAH